MKRLVISFFITLILYILLFLAIQIDLHPKIRHLPKKISKVSLSNIRFIKPKPDITRPAAQPKPQKVSPQKTSPKKTKKETSKKEKLIKKLKKLNPKLKKISKKKITKQKKSTHKKAHHQSKKKHKRVIKKPPTKITKQEHNSSLPSLMQLFAKRSTPKPTLSNLPPQIKKLYKDKFSTFTKEQQKFIKDNLAKIGEITQKYLYLRGYPYIAVKMREEGVNMVEFYLHPNGDITDLHLVTSSGYEALDKNSIETIKTAYKDYPLPKQTTLIRIYVRYSILY